MLRDLFTIKQFMDQVRMRLISQLINGISRVLQKLLKYFNDILTSFVSSFSILLAIFVLNLNKALFLLSVRKSVIALLTSNAGSSL